MPKVSIITLCYNQLENATKPFIESLYKHTDENLFELILINNASSDGTKEFLNHIKKEHKNIKIINNSENLGYSKGCNQGLNIASGDFLLLCNNDLLFTPNWIEDFIEAFNSDKKIGLLSVMTNFCGNINQVVKNHSEFNSKNYIEKWQNIKKSKKIIYQDKVIFFCVGLTREVFEKIGFLDENFGLAWFEDDDYTLRVLYHGYKPAFTTNVFIYHNHSQTTSKLFEQEEGKKLFEKNKKYFEEKHSFYIHLKKQIEELLFYKNLKWYRKIFKIHNDYSTGIKNKYLILCGIKIPLKFKFYNLSN